MMLLAVFRSRTQLFAFLDALRRLGVSASAVSTPQGIGVGCSLSARFPADCLAKARPLVRGASGFVGFYRSENFSEKTIVKWISV